MMVIRICSEKNTVFIWMKWNNVKTQYEGIQSNDNQIAFKYWYFPIKYMLFWLPWTLFQWILTSGLYLEFIFTLCIFSKNFEKSVYS